MLKSVLLAGVVGAMALAGSASAGEVQVRMLNMGAQGPMVFEPSTAKVKVGDTIRFIPTDAGHNAESIPELVPAGVTPVKGAMGKEVVVKITKPGVYGFKCMPHWTMGMVFIAKAGDAAVDPTATNALIAKAPPLTKKRLTAAFAAVK